MRALRAAPALAGAAILVACVVSFAAPPAGDPAAGEQVYARCLACHSPDRNRTGPKHCGLFGRVSGTAPGYDGYSEAMRDAAITWNAKTLDRFLAAPLSAVPGTSMGFAGVPDEEERADLIAYLATLVPGSEACPAEGD